MFYLSNFFNPISSIPKLKVNIPKVKPLVNTPIKPFNTPIPQAVKPMNPPKIKVEADISKNIPIPKKYSIDGRNLTRSQMDNYLRKRYGWNTPNNTARYLRQKEMQRMQTQINDFNEDQNYKNLMKQWKQFKQNRNGIKNRGFLNR